MLKKTHLQMDQSSVLETHYQNPNYTLHNAGFANSAKNSNREGCFVTWSNIESQLSSPKNSYGPQPISETMYNRIFRSNPESVDNQYNFIHENFEVNANKTHFQNHKNVKGAPGKLSSKISFTTAYNSK